MMERNCIVQTGIKCFSEYAEDWENILMWIQR